MLQKIDQWIYKINKMAALLSSILVFFIMILTFADVTGRFFIRPVLGTHEMTYLALALLVCLSLGFVQSEKGHISIGVFVERLSPRWQAIFASVQYLVMVIVLFLMSWQMIVYAIRTQTMVTGELGLSIYIFVYICTVGVVLYGLTSFLDFIKAMTKVVNPENES